MDVVVILNVFILFASTPEKKKPETFLVFWKNHFMAKCRYTYFKPYNNKIRSIVFPNIYIDIFEETQSILNPIFDIQIFYNNNHTRSSFYDHLYVQT